MVNQVIQKVVDPEAELSNVMRRFKNLAPQCSIAQRAKGIPQLAPQEKQIGILNHEMQETQLCIGLATKGLHATRDSYVKRGIFECISDYEQLETILRDERAQQSELDILNNLACKRQHELSKKVPTENDELAYLENANNNLRRMENRLDLATKRFCIVNSDNKVTRSEIHRLLVEREQFNIQWNVTIDKMVKGKEYLMDILEIATKVFAARDEASHKLETLKWKGLYQLNKDISEMQTYDSDLNHLAKLEEFLRVKGSRRICEADEKADIKQQEEKARCLEKIDRYNLLLDDIFAFADTNNEKRVMTDFARNEIECFSTFKYLCEILQEGIFLKKDVEQQRQKIMDQQDLNSGHNDKRVKRIAELTNKVLEQQQRTQELLEFNMAAEELFNRVLKGIDELIRIAKCDTTPLLCLLGNHQEVGKWNVFKFLRILEAEVKSLIEVVYGAIKPPAPTPRGKAAPPPFQKIVADPQIEIIRPNKIEDMVPYNPCAYCVEDFIMNQLYETPATPADRQYVETILHLEEVNTRFGIFTLTVPAKRHPYRNVNKGD